MQLEVGTMEVKKLINLFRLIPVLLLLISMAGGLAAQEVSDTLLKINPNPVTEVKNQSVFIVDTIGDLVLREHDIRAGLLYDAERGAIVWQKDMYYAYPIASLTKMMVALITIEDIKAGKVDWSDEVHVERVYKKSRRSRSVYKTTETYTLEALVQLAMIPSNNQACVDIAKYLSPDLETFVKRMNERAMGLNMRNTFYSNPSGLPAVVKEADNSASPHDLLLLAIEMIKYEEILKITSIGYAEVSNDKRTGIFRNHNHLVINYENDVDGLKTGYTKRAKFCLVATAKKEGHRMISIVLGVDGPYLRNEIVSSMLNNYYERIGCGPMTPSSGGPVARKRLVNAPVKEEVVAEADSNYTYKTVWTKQRRSHTVKSGETLSSIAQKYKSTYQQVKKWNRLSSNKIMKGQKLYVYVNVPKKVAVKNPDVLDNEDETLPETNDGALQVADSKNDSIGQDVVGPKVEQVVAIKKPAIVKKKPDPVKPQTTPAPATKKYVYHVVQPGDTLWSIAQRYQGISVDDLKKTNNISNSKSLKPELS
ncbi:MAG: LysM peptidoglycan-binding domain-containing protein [Bacteroidetes bacterium]|nr:LysM peptidoglycan-binding domain-containing protein [Bacteroidota bacterium]